jgi:oligopeptide/dipeptide ABC transporter ATP-binding protein
VKPLLQVEDLKTYFFTKKGIVKAVDGVSFTVNSGEVVGFVGESGCGKSVTSLSIIQLVPEPAGRIVGGRVLFDGEDLLTKTDSEMKNFRGSRITMILQDPLTSLNPVYTIGQQVAEPFVYHPSPNDTRNIFDKVVDVLRQVKVPAAEKRTKDYPHQFSGGMRQRVGAAIAIASNPKLLIADEPTTSLDVTIQAQFLKLILDIQEKSDLAVLYITHDLGVVAQVCDRVQVMYAGRIIETGDVRRIFKEPMHPYTKGLIESVPKIGPKKQRLFQIDGQPPYLLDLPGGCSFWPRCTYALDICKKDYPPEIPIGESDYVRCWLHSKESLDG